MLTVDQLARICENPDPVGDDLAGDVKALVPEMVKGGVTTRPRVSAFLGNVGPETDRLQTLEEYGGYSYWLYLDRNSGRAGEWRYHGRGYLMNTWREAYERLSRALGVDLVNNPDLLSTNKVIAARAALWFWTLHDLNSYADRGDFRNVASIINTGSPGRTANHLSDRLRMYHNGLSVLPKDFRLTTDAKEEETVVTTRRVIIPQTFDHEPTAVRVRDEIRRDVDLPEGKTVVLRDVGEGHRVVIPEVFTSVPTAERVRDEIRRKVQLPPDKTVVLHTPRPKQGKPTDPAQKPPAQAKPEPARPKTEKDRLIETAEKAFEFGLEMIGTAYGQGWREGTWPSLAPLYARIGSHDPPSYYRKHLCICSGLINIERFEAAELPSLGWDQGDGWPGGTAVLWRHYAFAPGSRPYPPVKNTPRHWLVVSPYLGAPLHLQGHVGTADGKGKMLEARVPTLSYNRTEAEVDRALKAGGARGNERIVPPELWLTK